MKTDIVASYVVLLVSLVYGAVAWLMQAYRVVPPRDWLLGRIGSLNARIDAEGWKNEQQMKDLLKSLKNDVAKIWFFVPTSKVQSAWRAVHDLEDNHVLELDTPEVNEQLRTAQVRLKAISGPEAESFTKRIDAALKESRELEVRRALLREANIFRHNSNDTHYENLANLLSKAVWLTWLALAIVVGLSALFDRESYFLLGAGGGLISRLTRVLRRRPEASDWGAEWSTLILSPAAGALAGWVGVSITVALAGNPLNVLSDAFAKPWDDATAPLGLLLAFLFGFSERLFDRLLGVAESQIGGTLPANQ